MRDLMSVTVQGLYRMSGVSNDPQSRDRVYISREEGWHDIIAATLLGEVKRKNVYLDTPFSEVGERSSHHSAGNKASSQGSTAETDTQS